jgi:cytochrome c peroxidase
MRTFKLLLLLPMLFLSIALGLSQGWPLSAVAGQSGGPLPAAPTGLVASDGTAANRVSLHWDTMRYATSYRIYRHTTNDAAAAVSLGTTPAGAFFDTTAVAGQTYFYWVKAENGTGGSGLSLPEQGSSGPGGNAPPLIQPPVPAGNAVTATKAWLGKTLFWDEQLAATRTVACGTCHHANNGGADPRSNLLGLRSTNPGLDGQFGTVDDVRGSVGVPLNLADGSFAWSASFGINEQVTGRRSMSYINAGYPRSLFWDGRATEVFRDPLTNAIVLANGAALESQVLGPPVNETEMGHAGRNWNDVAARLLTAQPLALAPVVPAALTNWIDGRSYAELFTEAFGSAEITPARIALAIATFERTLNSEQTPLDIGNLTAAEARGLQVFNQSRCDVCHRGPLLSDDQFHNTGIRPAAEDQGLFAVTGNPNDMARFRTPGLRNVELRAPYMHNGRFATLEEVVEFYNRGGDVNAPNLERNLIRPLNLNPQQKADLVAFLKRPLTDPRVTAETAPFDRPQLYGESMRVPQIKGTGLAGAGGLIPQVSALEPPLVGNPGFTVGLSNALGGAQAVLVIERNDPGATASIPASASFARVTVPLTGIGAGQGYGSATLTIPQDAALVGTTLYGRWYVKDAAAAGGTAVTPVFQMTIFGTAAPVAPVLANVSAASYSAGLVAPESIVSGFGTNLAAATATATAFPLPETLAGVSVIVRDVLGKERFAPLFFVSPNQLNYLIPAGTATGEGTVLIRQGDTNVASGLLQIAPVAPGLFTANASGQGVPAAVALRVKADGSQSYEPVAQYDPAQNRFVALPLDLGAANEQVYLIVYGSGFRQRSELAAITAALGGTAVEVSFAGPQGQLPGLDQANLLLPRALLGRGAVELVFQVDGKAGNSVSLNIR